jgi:hypothetical protein
LAIPGLLQGYERKMAHAFFSLDQLMNLIQHFQCRVTYSTLVAVEMLLETIQYRYLHTHTHTHKNPTHNKACRVFSVALETLHADLVLLDQVLMDLKKSFVSPS